MATSSAPPQSTAASATANQPAQTSASPQNPSAVVPRLTWQQVLFALALLCGLLTVAFTKGANASSHLGLGLSAVCAVLGGCASKPAERAFFMSALLALIGIGALGFALWFLADRSIDPPKAAVLITLVVCLTVLILGCVRTLRDTERD